jgi:hypothetical protein
MPTGSRMPSQLGFACRPSTSSQMASFVAMALS